MSGHSTRQGARTPLGAVRAAAILLALVSALLVADTAVPALRSEAHAGPPSSGYVLRFADEFNGSGIDTSQWTYRTDVKAESAQLARNVSLRDGNMVISLRKERVSGEDYTGGGLVSRQRFRYGYYEARVRTNVGAGWHSAFWAANGDGSETPPPEHKTEIDGFEIDSHRPRNARQSIYEWLDVNTHKEPVISSGSFDTGVDTSAAFHVYGYEWTEQRVRFFIDGQETFATDYPPGRHPHDYLNTWLTAIAIDQEGIDDAALPGEVLFDYFRYYQMDHYVDNDGPASSNYAESGSWSDSNLDGFSYSSSRFACSGAASARWTPNLGASGTYAVSIYRVVHPNSDPATKVSVLHDGVRSTRTVDFSSGSSGWLQLGSWYFPAGSGGFVEAVRGGGCARADAVKFVRR